MSNSWLNISIDAKSAPIKKENYTHPLPFNYLVILLITINCSCALNLQPGLLIDRIKNRGPISVSASNPYLVANQYLEYKRKNSRNVRQFLNSRGSPAALEIQKPLFEETLIYFYYPENGLFYTLKETDEQTLVIGPEKLSGRKMDQVLRVVKGVSVR